MHMQHKIDPDDALRAPSFRSLYALTAVLGVLIVGHLILVGFGYEGPNGPLGAYDLALLAAVIGGSRIVYGALLALFEGNVGADLALAIAVLAALMLKENWVAAEVVFIAMVGESLEAVTFSRTHRELRRILELQPRTAHVLRGDTEVDLPVTEVQVGDRIVVRPGERIPIDGTVLKGQSAVDQSTLTGESLPADKTVNDSVFAGTLNQFGALEVRADKVGEDTTLAQVIHLVAEAQENKAPLERTADRFARAFLPVVLAAAVATLLYTNWGTSSWKTLNWMPTLAVLVVACPCALILATPAAVMAALAWLARRGVLIKGGVALERLAQASALAFDKTGTLTQGKLQLGNVKPIGEFSENELLAVAAAAEQRSEHLIARLVVAEAERRRLPIVEIDDFAALPGVGVVARVNSGDHVGQQICVGNRRLLEQQGVDVSESAARALGELDATDQTSLAVALNGRVIGVIGARDTIRPEAADVIHELRHLGIDEIALLTGDRRPAAEAVARAVGIDQFEAELLPQEKAAWLARWRQRDGSRRSVGMIGDGVNDAPALASADVGLALGGVGSDIAAEAGDLVLMGDPLTPLPGLVRLSRATVRVIRQNIVVFAFLVNGIAILLAAAEQLGPVGAAIYHQIGSFLVLVNAMRLLWFEWWERTPMGRVEAAISDAAGRIGYAFQPALAPFAWVAANRRRVLSSAAAIAFVAYTMMGITAIGPEEVGVAQRCGRFTGVLEPGLHFMLPPPWHTVTRFKPARVRVAEIGFRSKDDRPLEGGRPIEWTSQHRDGQTERLEDESLVLTASDGTSESEAAHRDVNLLELTATVHYSVRSGEDDLKRYLFEVRDPDQVVRALAEGVLRELAAQRTFWHILTDDRAAMESAALKLLSERADAYRLGVAVHVVALQDVHPPLQVVNAFHDVSSAAKDKERLQKEAEAYYRQQIVAAAGEAAVEKLRENSNGGGLNDKIWSELRGLLSGEAAAEVHRARADHAERTNKAAGEATSFKLRQDAHAQAPALSELRLYLDTVQSALADKDKLILDPDAAGRRQLFLANPERFNMNLPPALAPNPPPPRRTIDEEGQ